jgi:hypothetical protein
MFQSGCTTLYSIQQCMSVLVVCTLIGIWCPQISLNFGFHYVFMLKYFILLRQNSHTAKWIY